MTAVQIERAIAHHEARQLRAHPPRHWGHVRTETHAWRTLCRARGELVTVTPMVVPITARGAA